MIIHKIFTMVNAIGYSRGGYKTKIIDKVSFVTSFYKTSLIVVAIISIFFL